MAVQLIERFAFVFLPLSGEDNMTTASQPTFMVQVPNKEGLKKRGLLSIVVPLIRAGY